MSDVREQVDALNAEAERVEVQVLAVKDQMNAAAAEYQQAAAAHKAAMRDLATQRDMLLADARRLRQEAYDLDPPPNAVHVRIGD